ncbi:carbohydrate ABC transporter permease [Mesorhizobium sp. B2-8-5]|uniref:carbohydrate ABC transporter permease n=1 Tax=Mesorhizobium sp. B2-8-5 TaxID=2589903 RepID=UPI00112D01B1|nr:carbohydrate ABC transporter permease [Mesorhizobium sp. B2-8-5]UCI28573.1 carbohydrate ABC transporter permease [Mesorhizobium sp. B2-8-5]
MKFRPGRIIAYLFLIVLAVVGAAPFLYLVVLSTKKRIEILAQVPPKLTFTWVQAAKNYNEVLFSQGMLSFTLNSLIVVSIATAIALVIGTPAAYAFSRLRFQNSERLASTILSMRFMPPIAVAIPLFLMVKAAGLQDSYPGLILPYVAFSLPLVVWIMIGFFDEIPGEIDEAALIDGCTRVSALWYVMLPIVRPGLVTAALFGALFIWNEFLVALYVIDSRAFQTISLGAATLVSAQRPIDWNIAATVGVVTVIPILIFSLFVQRYIVRGITAGAVK